MQNPKINPAVTASNIGGLQTVRFFD